MCTGRHDFGFCTVKINILTSEVYCVAISVSVRPWNIHPVFVSHGTNFIHGVAEPPTRS